MGDVKKCCDLSELHMNLMEEIWAWLPIESVCRFRSVSKEWNVLLSSREFISNKWVKKPFNRDPWLVTVLDDRSHKWMENGWVPEQAAPGSLASCFFDQTWKETSSVSLSFLPVSPDPDEIRYPCFTSLTLSLCYGSAAGLFLLCRSREIVGYRAFIVCNPLTRTHVELPVLSLDVIYNAGIMSDSGDAYKVVVMGTTEQSLSLKVEIYDSIDKSWRIVGHLPENVQRVGRQLVFCNGYFYCLAIISERRTVVGYSIGEGTYIFRPLPQIAEGEDMVPHLLICGSRVLVAARILRNDEELLDVIIWELEKVNSSSSSSCWKEIARMPPSNLERFSMSGGRYFMNRRQSCCRSYFIDCIKCCVGVGDSIYFMVFDQKKVKEILAYSVTENTWSWLPNRTLDTTASTGDGWEIPVAFEPRPDMKVY